MFGSLGGTNITAYQFRFGSADASNDGFSNTNDELHYNWTVNEVDPTSTTPPTEVPRGNVQATEFFNAGTGHPNGRTFTFQKGQTLIPTANGQLLFELKEIVRDIARETIWYSVDSDRTTPIQANQVGQLPFVERINSVLLTFDLLDPVAGQSTLSLPVRLEFDTNTLDYTYHLYTTLPEDLTLRFNQVHQRIFLRDVGEVGSAIILNSNGLGTGPNNLRIVTSPDDATALTDETNDLFVHFTGFAGVRRRESVEAITVSADAAPTGWTYVDITTSDQSIDTYAVAFNTSVSVASAATSITTVAPNPLGDPSVPGELDSISISGENYVIRNDIPLFTRKTDLFLGTEGTPVERDFITTGSVRLERVAVTPYTTVEGLNPDGTENMVTYYFIPDIGRPPLPTTNLSEWVTGDGVWTTLDFTDNTVNIIDVTADNMVNLIG